MRYGSSSRLFTRERLFALLIGLSDGILTALTLAAGSVLGSHDPVQIPFALRVAAASSLSGTFVFFTAEYARVRGELVHAERQLNLTARGRLATTRLGRAVLLETLFTAMLSSVCNFVGALFPLLAGAVFPGSPYVAVITAIAAVGVLGVIIAYSIFGNPFLWAIGLMTAGGLLTLAGAHLRVAS